MGNQGRHGTHVNEKDKAKPKKQDRQKTHTRREDNHRSAKGSRGNSVNKAPPNSKHGAVEKATAPKFKMDQPEAIREAEKWAQRTLRTGVQGLVNDFAQLKPYVPPDCSTAAFQANPDKNRYPDVWCEDKTRVVLRWPANRTHDYINANYVATPNFKKRFICTQGPLPNTVADFWHMIIQEECENILMLCSVFENNIPKCAQYWPTQAGQKLHFDRVDITFIKAEQPPPKTDEMSIRRTTLKLDFVQQGEHKTRKVHHFHWTDWPDRGVPKTSLTAMVLLSYVRGSQRPIAIHCAAGIGRTGSITSIEYIIEHFTDGLSCEDMVEVVKGLRRQRLFSIQNHLQYLYVHRVLLMYFIDKYKAVAQTAEMQQLYEQFKQEYDKMTTGR